jgi:hypothetical protein
MPTRALSLRSSLFITSGSESVNPRLPGGTPAPEIDKMRKAERIARYNMEENVTLAYVMAGKSDSMLQCFFVLYL